MGSVPTIPNIHKPPLTCCHVQETAAIDSLVRRFWELEELPTAPPVQHPDDVECEEYYKLTTTRDPVSGRYIVSLPFKDDFYTLGDSFNIARKRFMCLERKLQASPKLRLAYDDVIKDYLTKNYISPAPPYDPRDPTPIYIIPHHAVLREDKSSTKLRMVLDASMPTSGSQRSLNDLLHVGPNLQGNLFTIILGFRLHAIAMTADCRQQFLQIFVREFDRRFQCFLYRFSPQDPLLLYQFNRVCFGIKSSPYHALRTVRQLVEDDGAKYPLASSIASSSLYMDDIAFSIPTECEAVSASQQLIDLFKGAQWDLVKWNSNSRNVLDNLPASHKLLPSAVEFDKTVQHKLLGLHWSSVVDCFYFKITAPADVMCSKRSILSITARLWDMMGFVAPTVVYNIPSDNYYHVSGIENPADVLSRGITPQNLVSHPLWFQGPQWARSDPSDWPLRSLDGESIADIPERKLFTHTVCSPIKHCALYDTALRVSSRRVFYIYRFLILEEPNFAVNKIIPALQNKYFAEEYSNILYYKFYSQAFNHFKPFIRNRLILIGRLSDTALEYAHKHPVILPRNDHIIIMIIDYYHIKYMYNIITNLFRVILITALLLSLPAPQVKSDHVSLLDRHSPLDKLVQSFWKRWRLEYLHGLQVRQKWNTPSTPINPGTVVVVINDNAPPLTWPLAVVEKVHPSKDDIARVCTVRTAKGTYLRPVVRLCPLPRQ
ncbi:uncharacterized protein LOC123696254 [Colias croceus]|uniref:uncharacterized protein LOC123696254 n=1 Tax=Colias crocea TaxID=72248 RepID=UPI001E281900|nr:uncharacterized protein LOC123696254 [Colias croceus]